MKFTLVFPSGEGFDLSVGLVFAPCAIWKIGRCTLLNPHRENPHYLPGDFQDLLSVLIARKYLDKPVSKQQIVKIYVIVHEIGHGVQSYLDDLVDDIAKTGFTPIVIIA
jgi:hypothetical protein